MAAKTARRAGEQPARLVTRDADLRLYTPDELVDEEGDFRFPTTARALRELAYNRRVSHSRMGGTIRFSAADVLALQEHFAVPAVAGPQAT